MFWFGSMGDDGESLEAPNVSDTKQILFENIRMVRWIRLMMDVVGTWHFASRAYWSCAWCQCPRLFSDAESRVQDLRDISDKMEVYKISRLRVIKPIHVALLVAFTFRVVTSKSFSVHVFTTIYHSSQE